MKTKSIKSLAKQALRKTDVLCSPFKQSDWVEIQSCSFDRVVGVQHTVVVRLRGRYTLECSTRLRLS